MATRDYLCMIFLIMVINVCGQTVTDVEGNVYKTVRIGEQIWMAENLKTTRLSDSTSIPIIKKEDPWRGLTTPGCCWFKNDQKNFGDIYGLLYNWHAVNTGKLCPEGWHVPADSEWITLTHILGGDNDAGGKLKEAGTAHWKSPNIDGTNQSGFTALPGGRRNAGGIFTGIGGYGYWWSATEINTNFAIYRGLGNSERSIDNYRYSKKCGFSVRCLKD